MKLIEMVPDKPTNTASRAKINRKIDQVYAWWFAGRVRGQSSVPRKQSITINTDWSVSINGDVDIHNADQAIPFKLNSVSELRLTMPNLTDATNFPRSVYSIMVEKSALTSIPSVEVSYVYEFATSKPLSGLSGGGTKPHHSLMVTTPQLQSWQGYNNNAESLVIVSDNIPPLRGIQKHLTRTSSFGLRSNKCPDGLLNLMLSRSINTVFGSGDETLSEVCNIINECLQQGKDVLIAQDLLVEAGYEDYATL